MRSAFVPSVLFASALLSTFTPAEAATKAAPLSTLVRAAMKQKQPAKTGSVAALIRRAHDERDPGVQKIAVSALLRTKLPLLREQKVDILSLVRDPERGLLPKVPPMPTTGPIEVRHYAMEGFLAAELSALKQAGYTVSSGNGLSEARKGRVHVVLRETGDDILRDMNDPAVHMVVYSGHSQIGGTVEQALEQPGVKGPATRKLFALFQCVGTQTLPLIKAKAPMAEVITSNAPLYVDEVPNFVRELYTGVEKGENYQRINRRFAAVAWEKGRIVSPNQTATLKNVDFDGNGQLDVNQTPGDVTALPAADKLRAESLLSGVHFLRTLNPYYVDETPGAVFTKAHASIPLVSSGFAKGDGKTVTHIADAPVNGTRQFSVQLDDSFKGAPPRFVGAAAVYELQMHLQKTLLGTDDARAKARALAFAGEYLELMPRQPGEAQQALDQLTAMKGLPHVEAYAMQVALAGAHILSEDQVDKVAALLK